LDGPRAAHQKRAGACAIARCVCARLIDDTQLDAELKPPLARPDRFVQDLLAERGKRRRWRCDHPERGRFGHAPDLQHLDAVFSLESLGHCPRHRGAADDDTLQFGWRLAGLFQVGEIHRQGRLAGQAVAGAGHDQRWRKALEATVQWRTYCPCDSSADAGWVDVA
jgi:hypothetical protein